MIPLFSREGAIQTQLVDVLYCDSTSFEIGEDTSKNMLILEPANSYLLLEYHPSSLLKSPASYSSILTTTFFHQYPLTALSSLSSQLFNPVKSITTPLIVALLKLTFEPSYHFILASIFAPALTCILLKLESLDAL
jgi:hypothetical protein